MKKTHFYIPNLQREDPIAVGSLTLRCTAEGWSGNTVSGYLVDFDPEHRQIKIQSSRDNQGYALKFSQLKRLKIDTQPELDDDFEPSGILNDPAPTSRSFVVHLRDGALYSGICRSHFKPAHGLWIFPKRSIDTDPARVFIPKSAVIRFEQSRGDADLIADNDFGETVLAADTDDLSDEQLRDAAQHAMVETAEQLKRALERQASLKPVPIGEALMGLGKITPEQLTQALRSQRTQRKGPLGQMLVDMGLVTPADLQTALARKMGYPFVDLNTFPIDITALRRVPMGMAMRHKVLPILDMKSSIVVAMADPLQFKVIDELEFSTQRKVVPVVSNATELLAKIGQAYRDIGMGDLAAAGLAVARKDAALSDPESAAGSGMDALQLAVELTGEAHDHTEEDKPIEQSDNTLVRLINSMITEAYYQRASDIHIEPYPGREQVVVRFRVDGEMRPYLELPSSYRNALVARIKIMCDLDISERRKPQDGKINFAKFGGLPLELRVATIPTATGLEDVVMRLLASSEPLPLESLHLSPTNLAAFEHIVGRPYGLFLCAGPTGSGKTTTLHSALKRLNTPHRKIWTAEDPVEITQRGLRQIQVNHRIGWSFASALRALLRADPDVIMVGEIRDRETAEMAIEASLTGHLVFSTLHTNSAAETIVRLIDLGVDPFSFADSLQGILAQRLVRRFCLHCVRSEPLPDGRLQELIDDYQAPLPAGHELLDDDLLVQGWRTRFGREGQFFMSHARGCERCGHTGFSGRVALHELLSSSPDVRHLVQSRARPQELLTAAIREGMRTLRQDGIEKVLMGLTSLAEVRASSNS